MTLNMMGSKKQLTPWLHECILHFMTKTSFKGLTFAEPMAGTGAVSLPIKNELKKLILNDVEFYSYVWLWNHFMIKEPIHNSEAYMILLNGLSPEAGFITENYTRPRTDRNYFTEINAMKIDAIRALLDRWTGNIHEDIFYHLTCSLMDSADKVANVASVYAAYLKKIKKSAFRSLYVRPSEFTPTRRKTEVELYNTTAEFLIEGITGDVLYLDPPYNGRQYGCYYHMLNAICGKNDYTPSGKVGVNPSYFKSKWCYKRKAPEMLANFAQKAADNFKYLFLSYSSDGIIKPTTIKFILDRYAKRFHRYERQYQRFKADNARNNNPDPTTEYLFCIEVN